MTSAQTILVFSDPHGRIPLLLRLVWQWQREHDRRVDLILVSGDLGVWPNSGNLDSSTRKYSQVDPAELGFQAFEPITAMQAAEQPEAVAAHLARVADLLATILPEVEAKIVFVGGNHEDYDYLLDCGKKTNEANAPLVSVEKSGRIWWLPPGHVYEHNDTRIGGISGIDPASCGRDPLRYHPTSVITDDSVVDSILRILDSGDGADIDVLLTHDGLPDAAKPGKGTFFLLEVIEALNPRYHFFGHYHSEVDPICYADWLPHLAKWYPKALELCANPGRLRTSGIHVNKLAFNRRTGSLRRQVMGLLEVDAEGEHEFHFSNEEWLSNMSPKTMWRIG